MESSGMMSWQMQEQLLYGLLPKGRSSTSTKHLIGQLYALVDMGKLGNEQRQALHSRFGGDRGQLLPLIAENGFENFAALGAMLIAPDSTDFEAQYQLLNTALLNDPDIVQVWLASTLPAAELAQHLQKSAFAFDEQDKRYLLRYYDPLITPTLYAQAPDEWQQWFFGPIIRWWFAQTGLQGSSWHPLAGYARPYVGSHVGQAPRLIIDEALWVALANDPIPARILQTLHKEGVTFTATCHNEQLAHVRSMLTEAGVQGFMQYEHLLDYCRLCSRWGQHIGGFTKSSHWPQVKAQALASSGHSLQALVQLHLPRTKQIHT